MTPLHVVVTGGRDYAGWTRLYAVLDELSPVVVHHGAARGADTLAGEWAFCRHRTECRHPADWKAHGKAAGPRRNADMLSAARKMATERGARLLVVAFPGGVGTAHCVASARKLGIEVMEVSDV